jgi:hypothetical protein
MTDKNQTIQLLFLYVLKNVKPRLFAVSFMCLIAMIGAVFCTGQRYATAATSDNINFQARLQNVTGSIVPDGYYNIEFKLYDAQSGGNLLWTETYYDSNGVTAGDDNRLRVVNGYATANLGSLTPFASTIPWDQQLWLTMNVGGTTQTATPTYDGEMSPRLKLTAVPYAFNAKTASQLVTTNGAFTSTLQLQPTTSNQVFQIADQGAAGTYTLLTQQGAATALAGSFIQNQYTAAQTAESWVNGRLRADNGMFAPSLDVATATALGIGTTNATSINLGNASTSSINLNTATIATNQTTVNVLNTTATTVNAFGQASDVNIGAADGRIDVASDSIYLGATGSSSLVGAADGLDILTLNKTVASTDSAYVVLSSGNVSGATSATGTTTVTTGNSTLSGNTGATRIWTGNAASGSSGNILMDVGTATTTTGAINIGATNASSVIIGNTTSAANAVNIWAGTTGLINLQSDVRVGSGAAVSNLYATGSSSLNIMTISQSAASTPSGNIWINSGNANGATSNSGSVNLGSGNSNVSGNSGNAFIRTGNAVSGNSGNIFIDPGTASATTGYVRIGVTNASAVTIGRTGVGTFLNGNVDVGSFAGTGVVTSTSTGILQTGILDRNNTTYFNTTLSVANGGTGATAYTTNGVIYGNGTGALQVTAAGTTGQCLQGSTGSAPTWATCGVTSMGAIDGQTKTATGAIIASGVLYLQSADASNPGLMTTAGQTIAGNKTFTGQTTLGGAVDQSQLIVKANAAQSGFNPLILLQSSASAELARLTADSGFNTAFGYQAMPVVTASGQYNVGLGAYALSSLTDGDNNSGFGYGALFNTTTGIGNIGFGYRGMRANTTGSYNMGMGYSAGYLDSGGVFGTGATLQNATAIGAYAQVQASNSIVLGSVDTATKVGIGTTVPLNTFSVSPLAYATGTASQSGTTVTGSGTTWTSGMIGNQIVFADGTSATVTGFTDATHLTVTPSQTVASQAYRMHLPGLQVESDGNVAIGRTSASYSLDVGGTTKTDLFINRGVLTTSSGASGVANWTKIGTCHLYAQNEECRSLISFASVGVSSDTEDRAKLDFMVKQQAAMASAPWVRVVVDESVGYTKDSFVAITATNNATDTVVDLYFQYQASKLNQQFSIAPQHTSGTRFFEPRSYQSLSPTLPAGAQTWGKIPAQTGLIIENWNGTDYAAKFINGSNTTTADGIYIQAGPLVGSRTSGNVFAAFADSSGTVNGRIYGTSSGVTYGTTGADIAEYFKADSSDLPQVGELVAVNRGSSNAVYRARQGDALVGVVSNQSGYVGNGPDCKDSEQDACVSSYEKSHVVVGLLGQVPLKVNTEGGIIRPGDPITASSVPGVGAKAVGNVNIVGYALTDVNAEGRIQVILQPHQASQSLQGSAAAFASLTVGGTASIQGSFSVTGDTTLASVTVNGRAVFNGDVVINGTLETAAIRVNGHITLKGVAPTVTLGNALGIGDAGIITTEPTVMVDGTDGTGTITAKAGTQSVASGVIAHLTFNQAFDTSHKVIASASNSGGADIRIYVSKTSDGFDIISRDTLTVGQTYTFDYVVMGVDQQQP